MNICLEICNEVALTICQYIHDLCRKIITRLSCSENIYRGVLMRKELFSLHVLFIYFSSQGNSQLYLLSIVPKYPRVYQEIIIIIINNSLEYYHMT